MKQILQEYLKQEGRLFRIQDFFRTNGDPSGFRTIYQPAV